MEVTGESILPQGEDKPSGIQKFPKLKQPPRERERERAAGPEAVLAKHCGRKETFHRTVTLMIDDCLIHLHEFTKPSLYVVICRKESITKLSMDENVDNLALIVTGEHLLTSYCWLGT